MPKEFPTRNVDDSVRRQNLPDAERKRKKETRLHEKKWAHNRSKTWKRGQIIKKG